MKVVQCWDDGVTTDLRLVDMLRRHGAKASFNLNPGLHLAVRGGAWKYRDTLVQRLALGELVEAYRGFTIANHTVSHPHLPDIDLAQARMEIVQGRDGLQQHFQQDILGFAYPFGTYNEAVMDLLREAGHVYARTVVKASPCFPPADAMAFHPDCHFMDADFLKKYEAARAGGVFYFWGHSYEMVTEEQWASFEQLLAAISADPESEWADVADVFFCS